MTKLLSVKQNNNYFLLVFFAAITANLHFGKFLHYICQTVVGSSSLQQRNTAAGPPCFINDSDPNETNETLSSSLGVIRGRVKDLKFQSDNLIAEMERRFSVRNMNNASFWNTSLLAGLTEVKTFKTRPCNNITLLLKTQSLFYDILNGLANYLEHVPQILLQMKNMDFLSRLISFQRNIYSSMCQIKIVLRDYQHDPDKVVPSGDLSSVFLQLLKGTREDQIISEYVVLLDSRRIFNSFLSFYNHLNISSSICHSQESASLIG